MKKILQKVTIISLFIVMIFSLIACDSKAISFATDIINDSVVTNADYTFTASAMYGDKLCDLAVTCNDIALTKGDNGFMAHLNAGDNEIILTATAGRKIDTKAYIVKYHAVFEIISDIENANIVDDILTFSANATFNDIACSFAVKHNGKIINEKNGNYAVTLIKGDNKFELIARNGDNGKTKEWAIYYDGFAIITDLKDTDTIDKKLSFRANAAYGKDLCDLLVTVNGETIAKDGNEYNIILQEGESKICLVARHGNMSKTLIFTARYTNAAPSIESTIADNKIYKGSIFNFDIIAKDGLGKKLAYDKISFSADWNNSGNFVPISGVSKVWDDTTMSSFRINFKSSAFLAQGSNPFILRITATDAVGNMAAIDRTLTYQAANKGEEIGKVSFALEGFSVSCGYLIEPTLVTIYEGVPFSKSLTDIITAKGWTYDSTGTIDRGFYLSSIKGLELSGNKIADGIRDYITKKGLDYEDSITGDSLSEFDYGSGSGWMYSANGIYKNYGFSDYYPQDGDVVRVQFTLLFGEDLGGGGALGGESGGSILGDNPDYSPILKLLTKINANATLDKTVYNKVIKVVSVWNISQESMDSQMKILKNEYGVL